MMYRFKEALHKKYFYEIKCCRFKNETEQKVLC